MMIKIVCSKCESVFDWMWGKKQDTCVHCGELLAINEVRMAQGEVMRLFK